MIWNLQKHEIFHVFVSFNRRNQYLDSFLTGSEKRALFWRFHAETLISHWDIYVFVSETFNRSIPLFGLISTGLEKRALFWRFHAEVLISCWDIYVFVSVDHSIPLVGLILTSLEKQALFWRFCAEMLISHWDINVSASFDLSISLFGLIFPAQSKWVQIVVCYNRNLQKHKYLSWDINVFVFRFRTGTHFSTGQNESK